MTLRLSAAARQALAASAAANGVTARAWIERCLILRAVADVAPASAAADKAPAASGGAPTRTAAFRLGATAHALLYARAAEAGVSTRAWLEQAILANRTAIIAKAPPNPDLKALIFQVNKTGNNLNQLARHFNELRVSNQITGAQFIEGLAVLSQIEEGLAEALARARKG